jgi:pyruvate dehydrogenase E1 component alpha subunit
MEPIKKTVFEIPYYQALSPQGQLLTQNNAIAQDFETLITLYKAMIKARVFDNKAIALQRTGRMGTYPSCLGQEAISIGVVHAMHSNDVFVPYYRDFGGMLMRGVRMEEILLYWGGDERGSDFLYAHQDFPHAVPIASQCLHAAGVATAFKLKKQPHVAVVMVGDGGTSKGDFYEAINVAGAWTLPLVTVINNNQWAISVPRSAQTATQTLAQKGIAAGLPSVQVDGNDVLAVYQVAQQAINRARTGGGATLIEALSYRIGDHTTADDASRYRSKTEVDHARTEDPILRLNRYLTTQNVWNETAEQDWQSLCTQAVDRAVAAYFNMAPQTSDALFDYLYETLPAAYEPQRLEARIFSAHSHSHSIGGETPHHG